MKNILKSFILTTVLVLSILISNSYTKEISMEKKVKALLESIETGDSKPVSYINPNKYIQHNLMVEDGLAGFSKALSQLPKGSAKARVKRVFRDGNYVFAHTEYNFFGPEIGFDIFRFEDGLIVEHWDNLQEIANTTVSGRSQIDGPTKVTDLDKTKQNKDLIKGLVEEIFIKGKSDKITNYISTKKYYQHNPNIGDGLEALGKALEQMAKSGTPMVYKKNHIILGQGNFVLAVSEGEFMGKHVSFYDLFRIENGKVVEHWDTVEEILPSSKWKNSNGKFGFKK